MKGDRERCLAAGMDGYVSKPVQITEPLKGIESGVTAPPAPPPGAPKAACTLPVFDRGAALDRLGGDEQFLAEVIGLFLEDVPRLREEVRRAVLQRDAVGLRGAAHALKGSVGYVSAGPASEAVMRLEAIGASGDLTGVGDAWQSLDQEIERLTAALTTVVTQPTR